MRTATRLARRPFTVDEYYRMGELGIDEAFTSTVLGREVRVDEVLGPA